VAHVVALVAYRFSIQVSVLSIQNHCRAKQHSVFVRQSFNRLFRCAIIVLRNSTYCAVTILVRTQYFARLQRSYAALPILLSSLLAQKRHSGGRGALVGFSGKVCSILAGGQAHSSHKSPSVRGHGPLSGVGWLHSKRRLAPPKPPLANLFPFLRSPRPLPPLPHLPLSIEGMPRLAAFRSVDARPWCQDTSGLGLRLKKEVRANDWTFLTHRAGS
jgi:hypothetical protein